MDELLAKIWIILGFFVDLHEIKAIDALFKYFFPKTHSIYNGSLVAQLVGCWTHNPRVVGSIPGDADCFIWDNIPGQDVNLDCASLHPGVMGTWLLVGS